METARLVVFLTNLLSSTSRADRNGTFELQHMPIKMGETGHQPMSSNARWVITSRHPCHTRDEPLEHVTKTTRCVLRATHWFLRPTRCFFISVSLLFICDLSELQRVRCRKQLVNRQKQHVYVFINIALKQETR